MLLDDVGITVPHALEAVREVETIADWSRAETASTNRVPTERSAIQSESRGSDCLRAITKLDLCQSSGTWSSERTRDRWPSRVKPALLVVRYEYGG